jgi:SAM-dependent methyltransferase
VNDYRTSHLDPDCPRRFDGHYVYGHGKLYWEHFERPYLEGLFARLGRQAPGRYLDFACGTGRIMQLAAPHFAETVGIDVSQPMLDEARRRVPAARLICADVLEQPVSVGTFRVVSLFRFFLAAQHDLRAGVLRWLRDVIEEDGVLVLNNHLNRHSLTGLRHRVSNRLHGRPGAPPAERDVRALVGGCGFEIVDAYGFGVIPPWIDGRRLPSGLLLAVERRLGSSRTLQRVAKDRIYVCRPR